MLCVVLDLIPKTLWGTRLRELPTRTFLQLFHLSFGCIQPWVELIHLPQMTYVSLSFLLNSTSVISLAFSYITAGDTASQWRRQDNYSWALLFSFIVHECDQPRLMTKICMHLLPLLDTAVENSVSLYTLCGNLLYCNWWSFVHNLLDKDCCNTDQTLNV